jgi:putative sigma-54 modulation protein
VQVQISCRHGSLKPDVQSAAARKAEKLLTFFERVTAIMVAFDVGPEVVKCEILVDAEHKHNFVAHDEGVDAMTAFDQTLHKMEQQIRKYKEKVQDHRRDKPLGQLAAEAEPEPAE